MKSIGLFILFFGFQLQAASLPLQIVGERRFAQTMDGVSCPMVRAMMSEGLYGQQQKLLFLQDLITHQMERDQGLNYIKELINSAEAQIFMKTFVPIQISLPEVATDGVSFVNVQDGFLPMHKSSGGSLPEIYGQWDLAKEH